MRYDRPYWKILLKQPHLDVEQTDNQVYFRLKGGALQGGQWLASVDNFGSKNTSTTKVIQSQSYPISQWGVDFGFNWNFKSSSVLNGMRFDVIGFSYDRLGGGVVNDGEEGYDLNYLNRYQTRFLWVGYQLPMWRITPYFNGGLLWVYETGEIESGAQDGQLSAHSLRLGWEAGIDYTFSSKWVIKVAFGADTWPNERSSIRGVMGVAYAFSLLDKPLF